MREEPNRDESPVLLRRASPLRVLEWRRAQAGPGRLGLPLTPRPVPVSGFRGWGAAAGTQGRGPRHLPVVAVILERREVLLELAIRLLQPLAELLEAVAERRLEGRVLRVHARAELRSALPIAALAPSPLPAPGAGLGRTWAGPGRGRSRGRELGRGRAGRRRRHSATRGPVAARLPGFPPGRGRPSPRSSAARCQPPCVLYPEGAKLKGDTRGKPAGGRALRPVL